MANKYKSGTYIVRVFDKYGTKITDLPGIRSKVEADKIGEERRGEGSYVVLLVVSNSADKQRWQ